MKPFVQKSFRLSLSLMWGLFVIVLTGFVAWRMARFIIWPPARTELPVIQGFRGVLRVPFEEDAPQEPALRVYDNLSSETPVESNVLKVPEATPSVQRVVVPPKKVSTSKASKRSVINSAIHSKRSKPTLKPGAIPQKPKSRVSDESIETFLSRLEATRKRRPQSAQALRR